MARVFSREVEKELEVAGFTGDQIGGIRAAVESQLPAKVYSVAVAGLFFVAAVFAIVVAGVSLFGGSALPEGFWVAFGTCIGALAGIFTGQKVT